MNRITGIYAPTNWSRELRQVQVSPPVREVNLLVMRKGEEWYAFAFSDEFKVETLRTLGRYAANPELSFSWYDAAVLSKRVREAVRDHDGDAC